MNFKFGDRVEIGGRTMLSPGFSLVGLAGMVIFPSSPNAPSGTPSVKVDWLAFDYTPENGYAEGSLPPVVNVPEEHLILLEENPATLGIARPILKPNPNAPKKPQLGIVHGGAEDSPKEAPEAALPRDNEGEDEPPRPKLRLV